MAKINKVDSSKILARLLSTENITVEFKKERTASFDLVTRNLVIPILIDSMEPVVTHGMIIHEVGHALFSPIESLIRARDEGLSHSTINILEDVRIENLMSDKFLGAKNVLKESYNILYSKEFFGSQYKIESYNFLDRINVKAKCGVVSKILFEGEELVLWKKIEGLRSIEEMFELAHILETAVKKQQAEDKKQKQQDDDSEDDEDQEGDDDSEGEGQSITMSEDEGDSEGEGEGEGDQEGDDDSEGDSEETTEGDNEGNNESGSSKDDSEDDYRNEVIVSETEKLLKQSLEESTMSSSEGASILKWKHSPLKDKLVSEEVIQSEFKRIRLTYYDETDKVYAQTELFDAANKQAETMYREFLIKKRSTELSRTQYATSGVLDEDLLVNYMLTDKIFKQTEIVKSGANYGFVVLLDWSGSMIGSIKNMLQQVVTMTLFCKKADIPIQCFAFTSLKKYNERLEYNDIGISPAMIFELFNSSMSIKDIRVRLDNWGICLKHGGKFTLGLTPTHDALWYMKDICVNFKRKHNVEKMNFMLLTDGSPDVIKINGYDFFEAGWGSSRKISIDVGVGEIWNISNREEFGCKKLVSQLAQRIRDAGINVTGLYSISGKLIRRALFTGFAAISEQYNINNKITKKDFKDNIKELKVEGFDSYLLTIDADNQGGLWSMGLKDDSKVTDIRKAFMLGAKTLKHEKMLVNALIKALV